MTIELRMNGGGSLCVAINTWSPLFYKISTLFHRFLGRGSSIL